MSFIIAVGIRMRSRNSNEKHIKMFHPNLRTHVKRIRPRKTILRRFEGINSNHQDMCQENLKPFKASVFRQFLSNTTLHGLKYLGDNTITYFER